MDLREYLRVLRLHWRIITACTLLAIAAAAAVSLTTTPIYQSRATLFISTPDAGGVAGAYTGSLFTQQRVKSYVDFVSSPKVAQAVKQQLHLPDSVGALAAKVSADAPLDTSLINVTAQDPSRARAQRIAQGFADQFSQLATSLESAGTGPSNVKITVVRPAGLPGAPVTPRTKLNLALGLLVGLAIGIGYSVLRETLDTRVKTVETLDAVAAAPHLVSIGFDETARRQPLVVQNNRTSPRGEAFRQLRTNLRFADVDNPPRAIVVTSSLPGEGKTTTACNLAITMAAAGIDVVLVEGDLRRPRLGDYLGIEPAVGLTDVLAGEVTLNDALRPWGPSGRMSVLPAGTIPPNPSELLGSHQMQDLITQLTDNHLVLIDAPPLLPVTDAAVLTAAADGAILVVRAKSTKKDQVTKSTENVRNAGGRIFGTVFNMAPTKGPDAYGYGIDYYRDTHRPTTREAIEPSTSEMTDAAVRRKRRSAADKLEPGLAEPVAAGDAAVSPLRQRRTQ